MRIALTEKFIEDMTELPKSLVNKCRQMLKSISGVEVNKLSEEFLPGWRLHKLKTSPFFSISLDMNFRVLVKFDGDVAYFHRAVKHDLADQPRINQNEQKSTTYNLQNSPIMPSDIYGALVSLGLSEQLAQPFRSVKTEDDLLDILGKVDEKTAEYALSLYETSGVVFPRTKYVFLQPNIDFETSFLNDVTKWELYLHPSQNHIVELACDYRIAVSGSAGTGKTVCAWYRFQKLNNEGKIVGFVCPNQHVLNLSKKRIEKLIKRTDIDAYYLVPTSSQQLEVMANTVDHIIVDEGQEISPEWYKSLSDVLKTNNTGLTLFYDLNQLWGNIKAGDMSRYKDRMERWSSTLKSIPKCKVMELFINYRNSKEIAQYYFDVLKECLPFNITCELPVFQSGSVIVRDIKNINELTTCIVDSIKNLRQDFLPTDIMVVTPSGSEDYIREIISGLVMFGVPATDSTEDLEKILVASSKKVKGNEKKAVIVCINSNRDLSQKWGRAISSYVSMSRARDRLVVIDIKN